MLPHLAFETSNGQETHPIISRRAFYLAHQNYRFFSKWFMAGGGSFKMVGRSLVAQPGDGIGLLFYAAEQFDNFTLRFESNDDVHYPQ